MVVEGWAGCKLEMKLKLLKGRIKDWARHHFGNVRKVKEDLLKEIQRLHNKEEEGQLLQEEECIRLSLKEYFSRNVREEGIKWKQRSRCRWLNEGDTPNFSTVWLQPGRDATDFVTWLTEIPN